MELAESRNGKSDGIKLGVYMGYAVIVGILIILVLISAVYTCLKISLKRQIYIDVCFFSVMLIVTIAFRIPNNLLIVDLAFFLWAFLGNVFGYFYTKFWGWIDNHYLKKHGIPSNKKIDKEESGNTFICRLLYFTIKFSLVIVFLRAIVLNLIEK